MTHQPGVYVPLRALFLVRLTFFYKLNSEIFFCILNISHIFFFILIHLDNFEN